jgi:hypothetical protein
MENQLLQTQSPYSGVTVLVIEEVTKWVDGVTTSVLYSADISQFYFECPW